MAAADPPQRLHPACDCDACCDSCGHKRSCPAVAVPECTCPDSAEHHRDDCPEWIHEQNRRTGVHRTD